MWFFFRFFVATYIQKIKPTKHILEWVSAPYRVMPWDLDANLHMNNVKYLKYLERGRVEHMIHTPWLRNMYRSNAKALIANTEVSYVKEMRLFQQLLGGDSDADKLLTPALKLASNRVVVKRPDTAPWLDNQKPSMAIESKKHRFDVYLTNIKNEDPL